MEKPDFILIDDDKITLFLNELEIKRHCKNMSIASYVQSDAAFDFIQDNFNALQDTVILLDLNMPVMDGFQVLEKLLAITHNLIVIIVTSSISDEDREKAMNYPFVQGYITKPLKGLELKNSLTNI